MGMDAAGWRDVMSFFPEVIFAVVGISLSIVSLILQLSATVGPARAAAGGQPALSAPCPPVRACHGASVRARL